ncbi:hypothetical protein M899_2134 [Bacteriovorax sp. BSW11_IV]|uniref:hypothetical protein n=1 Tax=Bacteriovorax sp. BSW11_IV TaxID=1353529 RepID=UPI00038A2F48|nr:hypothetical protein [Bacteriovorax sp. BSW11_IV]EQC47767.1 hypothetical protein M899_2134 [Bacteriovorax sp. BSW11_IV]
MKSIILLMALTLNTSIFAADFLTRAQNNKILLEIDNICGDTWCEGDFNFNFPELTCDDVTATCTLSVYLFDGYNDTDGDPEYFMGKCEFTGITSYEQMIEQGPRWSHLNQEFYENITDCITELEDEARPVIFPNE